MSGRNVYLGQRVRIFPNVTIGDNVFVDDDVTLGYPNEGEFWKFVEDLQAGVPAKMEEYVKSTTEIQSNSVIRSRTIVCSGTKIGPNLDCDHDVYVGGNNSIGKNAVIQYKAMIYHDNLIGDDATISGFVCNSCKIGNDVAMLGYLVHNYDRPVKVTPEQSPKIEDGATIGMLAVVIGGVAVGRGSYVAAGAVVNTNVRAGKLVAGVPAREICDWPKKST